MHVVVYESKCGKDIGKLRIDIAETMADRVRSVIRILRMMEPEGPRVGRNGCLILGPATALNN